MPRPLMAALIALLAACSTMQKHDGLPVRFATFNASLYSDSDGGLVARLAAGDDKARKIAAVVQKLRPDVLLLNEFDYDAQQRAADLFQRQYLEVGQFGEQPIRYPYRFLAPVNTGIASGMDLDRNGRIGGGNDAFGFGLHEGQYGMLVLSRYPIDAGAVRTFQKFPWASMPGAKSPVDPATGAPWYAQEVWQRLRLSSKSHWDVPIETPAGVIHLLAHHPTPPVFDGAEDRNGWRNHDEIRLWAEFIGPGDKPWLCDDQGRCGGLPERDVFVIAGDHNADPMDGDSTSDAIGQLLKHPRVLAHAAPRSRGAVAAAQATGGGNLTHKGDPAQDTSDFGPKVGNLRVDYLLPSTGLVVQDSGVFWPRPDEPGARWLDATDHRLVWMDLLTTGSAAAASRATPIH